MATKLQCESINHKQNDFVSIQYFCYNCKLKMCESCILNHLRTNDAFRHKVELLAYDNQIKDFNSEEISLKYNSIIQNFVTYLDELNDIYFNIINEYINHFKNYIDAREKYIEDNKNTEKLNYDEMIKNNNIKFLINIVKEKKKLLQEFIGNLSGIINKNVISNQESNISNNNKVIENLNDEYKDNNKIDYNLINNDIKKESPSKDKKTENIYLDPNDDIFTNEIKVKENSELNATPGIEINIKINDSNKEKEQKIIENESKKENEKLNNDLIYNVKCTNMKESKKNIFSIDKSRITRSKRNINKDSSVTGKNELYGIKERSRSRYQRSRS